MAAMPRYGGGAGVYFCWRQRKASVTAKAAYGVSGTIDSCRPDMSGNRDLTGREMAIYAAIGFSVWLNGVLTFRLGSAFLFESSPATGIAVALFICIAVCLIFRSTMRWRRTKESEALTVAVTMMLPGLFGEAARMSLFSWATGLDVRVAPRFAATMILGNAALIAYALVRARLACRVPRT
jgi:hypothetical protein